MGDRCWMVGVDALQDSDKAFAGWVLGIRTHGAERSHAW